jgi:hypothetical protein
MPYVLEDGFERNGYLMMARTAILVLAQLHLTARARWHVWRATYQTNVAELLSTHRCKLTADAAKMLVGLFVSIWCGFVAVATYRTLDWNFGCLATAHTVHALYAASMRSSHCVACAL